MIEDIAILFEFIFREIPDYPHRIALAMRSLENADALGLFQLIWIPFNLYVLIRILQPSLKNESEPSRLAYCLISLVIWTGWVYVHFTEESNALRFVKELHPHFLILKLFTVYVNCLLLSKISVLIFKVYQMTFQMYRVDSVVHLIFKDANLKLIITIKTFTVDRGIRTFQARPISWSNRNPRHASRLHCCNPARLCDYARRGRRVRFRLHFGRGDSRWGRRRLQPRRPRVYC